MKNFVVTQVSEDEIYDVVGTVVYNTPAGLKTCDEALPKSLPTEMLLQSTVQDFNPHSSNWLIQFGLQIQWLYFVVDAPGYASLEVERRVSKPFHTIVVKITMNSSMENTTEANKT
ncbi:MAG: hypothetical protein R2877_04280 [Bdellovibrionota bacterium]